MKSFFGLLFILVIVGVTVTSLYGMQRQDQVSKKQMIKLGQDIDEAIKVMSQAGIIEGLGLAIVAPEKTDRLTGWPVINGYLVARYSTINNRIVALGLHLNEKDPKPRFERNRDLIFKVNSYSPSTGEMLLIVPNKAMQKSKR